MRNASSDVIHLTPRQVAERLCVTERTLERWRRLGIGPAYLRLPGRVRYRLEDIELTSVAICAAALLSVSIPRRRRGPKASCVRPRPADFAQIALDGPNPPRFCCFFAARN